MKSMKRHPEWRRLRREAISLSCWVDLEVGAMVGVFRPRRQVATKTVRPSLKSRSGVRTPVAFSRASNKSIIIGMLSLSVY